MTTVTNGTTPAYSAVPDTLSTARRLAIIQSQIVSLMEQEEALAFAVQVMRRVGDDPALTEPQRKEIARIMRLLKEYRKEEAALLAALNDQEAA